MVWIFFFLEDAIQETVILMSTNATKSYWQCRNEKDSSFKKKTTVWSSRLGIKTEKSNYNARKRTGSISTLKLTKFYKLRDGCSLGVNNKNY